VNRLLVAANNNRITVVTQLINDLELMDEPEGLRKMMNSSIVSKEI
jgi:hypothetical protein